MRRSASRHVRAGARAPRARRRSRRARVPDGGGGARPARVRGDRRGGRARSGATSRPAVAHHRPRRLRRRRRVRHRDAVRPCAAALGADVGWFLPSRVDDGYGLSAATVERLAARGTRLLVTVDCAITAVDEVAPRAPRGRRGRHRPPPPRADGGCPTAPIVHPAICGYPCPDLCGTGRRLQARAGARMRGADRPPRRGPRARRARDGRRPDAAARREPPARARRACARWPSTAKPGPAGADARRARRPERARRPQRSASGWRRGSTPPAGCAAPTRALELLLTATQARARRSRTSSTPSTPSAAHVEQRILWEAEAQVARAGTAQRLRARRRGLASRRDRDRRLADRRAPLTARRS